MTRLPRLTLLLALLLLPLLRRTVAAQASGLLQLLAKLFGFAAQHFLLPSLLGSLLLALMLLFGDLLLALGELLEFLKGVVDILLLPIGALALGLGGSRIG